MDTVNTKLSTNINQTDSINIVIQVSSWRILLLINPLSSDIIWKAKVSIIMIIFMFWWLQKVNYIS